MCPQVAPIPGARFSPAFLDAVAAWAAVQQRRQLSPSQRPTTPPPPPPPPPQQPPAESTANAGRTELGSPERHEAGAPDAQSAEQPACSDADAAASVGSAASVKDHPVADSAEELEPDIADEAAQTPAGTPNGSAWEDYSSAAWIAEALGGLQVGDDSQRGIRDESATETAMRASAGDSSVEAAASLRGSGVRPSTSGDDSDEVTSPLTRLPGP